MSNVVGKLAADTIAKIWLYREKVEFEVSFLFGKLYEKLTYLGAPKPLSSLVAKAQEDELQHASMCRSIIVSLNPKIKALPLELQELQMPGKDWNLSQKALYTSVALSCITETFSTALLLEMRKLSSDPLVKQTVRKILKDEIAHSRIGWAHLAWANSLQQPLAWLSDCIPAMLDCALVGDSALFSLITQEYEAFGILTAETSKKLVQQTFYEVIVPGLQLYGISPEPAIAKLQRQNLAI